MVAAVTSTVAGVAKGLASCLGTSDIHKVTGNSMNPTISIQNTNNIAPAVGGSMETIKQVGLVVGIASAAFVAAEKALQLYQEYDAKDDHRIFAKLSKEDCGGVSKMLATIRGCYKQYTSKATHRAAVVSPNPWAFYERFNQCFPESLAIEPCSFFGENIFSRGE